MSKISKVLENINENSTFDSDVINLCAKVNKKIDAGQGLKELKFYIVLENIFDVKLTDGKHLVPNNFSKTFTSQKIQIGDIDVESTTKIRLGIPNSGYMLQPQDFKKLSDNNIFLNFYGQDGDLIIVVSTI